MCFLSPGVTVQENQAWLRCTVHGNVPEATKLSNCYKVKFVGFIIMHGWVMFKVTTCTWIGFETLHGVNTI